MTLNNKIALVTGASRGIGKAIAIKLAQLGATVAAVDYKEEFANQITSYFSELNLKGQGFVMDVADQVSVDDAMKKIVQTYGAPNILINNAGITRDNLLMRMSIDEWQQVIDTNLSSVFRLSRVCIRDMVKARWGRIVNLASVVAYMGNPGQVNYCAAKAGMIAFSKALAQEMGSRNITVNSVAPGFIDTDMTKQLSEAQREAMLTTIPLKRAGTPGDVANAVAFLVSEDASYITGQTIHVNGGMFMV